MSTAKLHVTGSTHEARFGESFDAVLDHLLNRCEDPEVAASQLDELALLTVLAQFVAPGAWGSTGSSLASDLAGEIDADEDDPRIRHLRYPVLHQPGFAVDVVTFEGITLERGQTIVRDADVAAAAGP